MTRTSVGQSWYTIAVKTNASGRISLTGYLPVIAAAALWAASGSASKFLFQTGMTPFQLVQLRTTIATAVLAVWLLLRDRRLLSVDRSDIGNLLVLGMLLAAAQFTYLLAISRIQVAAAILLQYLSPVLIALYSVVFMKRKLGFFTWIAIAGAVTGCYLMVGGYDFDLLSLNREGVAAGLLSALTFAMYTVGSERCMRSYSPWTVVFYAFFFAAACWNIAHPPLEAFLHAYSRQRWALIIAIGILGTVLPFGLYNVGVKRVGAPNASITATLEPVIAGFLAFACLGERMGPLQIAGAAAVICSLVILQAGAWGRRDRAAG